MYKYVAVLLLGLEVCMSNKWRVMPLKGRGAGRALR